MASLSNVLIEAGHRPGHAAGILREFYQTGGLPDFASMAMSRSLREWAVEHFANQLPPLLDRRPASDGTVKLLLGFPAGGAVETVMMPAFRPGRAMGCVSSQIGCAMGCDFCASTLRGLERNLRQRRSSSSSCTCAASGGNRPPAYNARLHGHGRADAQPRSGLDCHTPNWRAQPGRARLAADHGFDSGHRAWHRSTRRRGSERSPGRLRSTRLMTPPVLGSSR